MKMLTSVVKVKTSSDFYLKYRKKKSCDTDTTY